MSNFIKVPLAVNPARSFASVSTTIAGSRLSGGGTIVAGTISAAAATSVSPAGGSAATFAMTSTGTAIANVTLTCAAIGEGYKVDDVITVAIISPVAGKASATVEMTFTVIAADLAASSGAATEPFFFMPIDNVGAVVKDSATTCIVELKQGNATGTGVDKVAKYTITVDNLPATTALALQADVAAAVIKAASAENAQPEVKFTTSGVECLTVVLS